MFFLGLKKGLFCVADPTFEETKKVHIYTVELDEAYINSIIEKAELFWTRFIYPKVVKSAIVN